MPDMEKGLADEPIRILLLEDVPTDAELVQRELRRIDQPFTAHCADTRETFQRALDEFRPHVVLADYYLPTFDGREALDLVRARDTGLPFIFVSGALGEELAVEMLRCGATDFVLKSNLARLPQTVNRALAESTERERRHRAEAEIRRINAELERRVSERTSQLEEVNQALSAEIDVRRRAEQEKELLLRNVEQERERAEQLALLAQRHVEEMDGVFSAMVEPVIIFDTNDVIIRANPVAVETLGFDPVALARAELVKRLDMRHPDGHSLQPDELPSHRALSGMAVLRQELTIIGGHGRFHHVLASGSPLMLKGQVVGAVSVWHDVTESNRLLAELERDIARRESLERALRRSKDSLELRVRKRTADLAHANEELRVENAERLRAEKALRENSEILEKLFSAIHVLVAYMDRKFNFVRVNAAYAAADGHPPEYYVGKNHFELFPNKENERIFRRVIRTRKPFAIFERPFEYVLNPERGVSYWDWNLQPVHGADGKVAGLLLSLLDVTPRKQAQLALAEAERRFRAVFEQGFDFMWVLDINGRVLDANRALLDFCSIRPKGVVGRAFCGTPCWPKTRRTKERLREAVRVALSGEVVRFGATLKGVAGVEAVVDMAVLPVRDIAGKVVLLIAEGRDVSEQHRLETRIQEVAAEERAQVGRDLHDSLGQQLTGVSFLSRGLQKRLAEASLPEADQAERICGLLHQAITQTRSLARGLSPVSLSEDGLLTGLEQLARNVDNVFGVRCVFRASGVVSMPDEMAAANLYFIAQEAVNNAVRHSQARRIGIRLTAGRNQLTLVVRDNGIGIPEGAEKGKGIGLSVMKQRARAIGAYLTLGKVRTGGTAVSCSVPLKP